MAVLGKTNPRMLKMVVIAFMLTAIVSSTLPSCQARRQQFFVFYLQFPNVQSTISIFYFFYFCGLYYLIVSFVMCCIVVDRRRCRELANCTTELCDGDCKDRGFHAIYQVSCETHHHHVRCCCKQWHK